MTTWYRGDDGATGGRWYAADRRYAAFFGRTITEVKVVASEILDLTEYGVGDEDTVLGIPGLPEYRDVELYLYVERPAVQAAARALGYRGIRVLQWHAQYSDEPQDTLYLL